jgi:hypothetical protein
VTALLTTPHKGITLTLIITVVVANGMNEDPPKTKVNALMDGKDS